MKYYFPDCRCDPRRPLNPPVDHEKSCPVREEKRLPEYNDPYDQARADSMEGGE